MSKSMTKSTTDILSGLACLVTTLVFYVQGLNLSQEANLYPKILEIVIAFMGVFLIARGGITFKTSERVPEVDFDRMKGLVTVIASVFYVAAIYYIGFYVATFFFLALCSWYLSQKGLVVKAIGVSAGFGLLMTVGLYLLFTAVLKVPTPAGLLF